MYSENESFLEKENCYSKDECIPYEQTIEVNALAKAYIPFQKFCEIFSLNAGLMKGTVFPELYQPYEKCKN